MAPRPPENKPPNYYDQPDFVGTLGRIPTNRYRLVFHPKAGEEVSCRDFSKSIKALGVAIKLGEGVSLYNATDRCILYP